ncbi:MAG TPA: hypothetical protein VN376_01345 [Longilinea sp.]|nr:hypothetical protein [Longilinea sp.]
MKRLSLGLLLVLILLTACNGNGGQSDQTPVDTLPTATSMPIETPTTSLPRVVLVAPLEANPSLVQTMQTRLSELAAASGMTLETRNTIGSADVQADWRIVVWLSAPADVTNVASAAPQTQFLAFTDQSVTAGGNLSVARLDASQQAFIGGYIAELLAEDWRAVGFLPSEDPTGVEAQQAFVNGGQYWCGSCSPLYPPYVHFPIYVALPTGTDSASWQSAYDEISTNRLNVVYVAPEAASDEFLTYLATQGMILIGGETPPDGVRGNWAVTITVDPMASLESIWPQLVAGQGGQQVMAAVQLNDINEGIFPVGHQRLVEALISELSNGMVDIQDP